MTDRRYGIIGLAYRAGKLAYGTNSVIEAVRNGKAKLVLAADGISENTAKQLRDKTNYRAVPLEFLPLSAEELGKLIGKTETAAVAFLQEGFVVSYRKSSDAQTGSADRQNGGQKCEDN
ncbi:MAG: ribosomal L7Ae/L30e/S12e/Gadd45 family protein [Clostridia bacterium]|nr:ribosomal L7Ae/L30e/S12e/Gadd45 family protein [Clostridia bacterium]